MCGRSTRTNVPLAPAPVTIASKLSPTRPLIATAAMRLDISRSTLREASAFSVQSRATPFNSASV